jgi:hypothetical protein
MTRFSLALLSLVAMFIGGCSDDSASPNGNDIDDGGNGSGEFTLTTIENDTAYWGERVVATLSNAATDSLTVFVHTSAAAVDSIWRDKGATKLRFIVPDNASSGLVRVYDRETLLAKGSVSLVVIPQRPEMLSTSVHEYVPRHAFPQDLIVIRGRHIPLDRSDVQVSTNGVAFEIVTLDSTFIVARVPQAAQTGELIVKTFTKEHRLSRLTIRQPSAHIPTNRPLQLLRFQGELIEGETVRKEFIGGDTITTRHGEPLSSLFASQTFSPISAQIKGDSIIFQAQQTQNGKQFTVDIRLREDSPNHVSGKMRLAYPSESVEDVLEIEIKNMPWNESGEHRFYAYALDHTENIISMTKTVSTPTSIETFILRGGDINSYILIDLNF